MGKEEEMRKSVEELITGAVYHARLSIEELRDVWEVLFEGKKEVPLCPHEPKLFPHPYKKK